MRPVGGSATETSDGGVGARGGKSGGVISEATAKTWVRVTSVAGQNGARPRRSSPVPTKAETRATNLTMGAEKAVNPHTWPVCPKIAKISGGKGEPTQDSAIGLGHQPTLANAGDRWGVIRPQALTRYIASSSTGVRRLQPLRSCSVAGCGNRKKKSALPFALRFRYSSV